MRILLPPGLDDASHGENLLDSATVRKTCRNLEAVRIYGAPAESEMVQSASGSEMQAEMARVRSVGPLPPKANQGVMA